VKAPCTSHAILAQCDTQMHVESAGARRSAGQFTAKQAKHGFVAMVIKKRLSVADVAEFLTVALKRTVPRSSVQAWYKPADDPAFRAPPEDAVTALKEKYAVPYSAWARIKSSKP
jgi:hypothetical protein